MLPRAINVRLKNSRANNTTGPTIYNKVVEKMATGIARTASQRMDSYGDEREAGGIEEDVNDSPKTVVCSTETEPHLYDILYCQY